MSATPAPTSPQRLIYLVDDEALLLDLAEVALLGQGYQLKKFDCPESALAAFTNEPSKPDLLLTDYAMGPMNGIELSMRCKDAHPDLKVLVVSGTAGQDVILTSPIKVDSFIAKPYRPAELANTVRELLQNEPPV